MDSTSQIAVYRRLIAATIRADWQYRTSFFLFLTAQTLVTGLELAVIVVLFTQVNSLGGWSAAEVALLYAVAGIGFGLADIFASQVESVSRHIKTGTFDLFLIRPAGPLLQLSAADFALRRVGRVVQPLAVLVVALTLVDVGWTPVKVILLPVAVVSGAIIFSAFWVLTSSLAFWTVDTQEVANAFTYGGSVLANYPVDVFGSWLRRLVIFVVPVAFTSYLPVAYLLDKPVPFSLPDELALLAPAVAATLSLAGAAVWRTAIRHYRSTGS